MTAKALTKQNPTLAALVKDAAALGDADALLSSLTAEQLAALGRAALVEEMRDVLGTRIRAARVNMETETDAWLSCYASPHTRRAYARAMRTLVSWCQFAGKDVLALSAVDADAFIGNERAQGRDADSVRAVVFACSSFFRFAERRYAFVRNPFRGSRVTPKRTIPTATIPTETEVRTIAAAAAWEPVLAAAVAVLVETGLRVGALPGMRVNRDGTFSTVSKGKPVLASVPLSADTRALLATLGREPFAGLSAGAIRMRFSRLVAQLVADGKIGAAFSVHDLRHAFAEKNKGKGLYWLARALNHSGVAVTENYLRNVLRVEPEALEKKDN